MSDAGKFTQCLLRRGDTSQRAFIPAKYAKLGAVLRIHGPENPGWVDGWQVAEVGQSRTAPEVDGLRCYARRSSV